MFSGKIEFSNTLIQEYMKKNQLSSTYLILNQSLITSNARKMIFDDKVQSFRNTILSYESPEQNISYDIAKLQILLLELLSNILMAFEEYLGHSYHLRKSLPDFVKLIASKNKRIAENEMIFLRGLKKKEISKYLLLPDIQSLNKLKTSEIKLVNKSLENIKREIFGRIKNIVKFYKRY